MEMGYTPRKKDMGPVEVLLGGRGYPHPIIRTRAVKIKNVQNKLDNFGESSQLLVKPLIPSSGSVSF